MIHVETPEEREREIAYKESLKAELYADAMMNGRRPHRPQYVSDNFFGQEGMEVTRDNFLAVEARNREDHE